MDTLITILIGLVCLVIGLLIGYLVRKKLAEARIKSAEEAAAKILIEEMCIRDRYCSCLS